MAIAEHKSERIEVRTTRNMKALLKRAAASSHNNVTEFLFEAGINAAEDAHVDLHRVWHASHLSTSPAPTLNSTGRLSHRLLAQGGVRKRAT